MILSSQAKKIIFAFVTPSLLLYTCILFFQSCSSSKADTAEEINIPFSLKGSVVNKGSGLELVTVATNITVAITGCVSGYTLSPTVINSGVVKLLKNDQNCLVKLTSMTVGPTTYSTTGGNVVNFTTWLAGDIATFQDSGTDLITVTVISQVTQSGVSTSDTISYRFTDVTASTTSNIAQAATTFPVSVFVTGNIAPNFTVTMAKVLDINSDGSPNMTFTLQCGSALTGSSTPTYACSSVLLNTQLDYVFVPDTYSQAALTVAQLTAAFNANTPTGVGSSIIPVGGSDSYSNTLTNGGFYTGSLTGGTSQLNSQLNYVFMIRQKDVTVTDVQSYTYFYVDISTPTHTTVSGCGTTFAGGAGTASNPYWVNDPVTLANTVNCTSSSTYFVQTQNINLIYVNWTPIVLYGQYDGSGYQILNLEYSNTSTISANDGLFSGIQSGASISNLTISNITLTSVGANAGALAGTNTGTITNVSASGTITHTYSQAAGGTSRVGGLVGLSSGGTITRSSSSVIVSGGEGANSGIYQIGGLVGTGNSTTISNSYASGSVSIITATAATKTVNMGNLIGTIAGGTVSVTQSYATGNLAFPTGGTGTTLRMGMLGNFSPTSGSISYSFAKGTYSASSALTMTIGGMVGNMGGAATVNNSYTMVAFSTTGQTAGSLGGFVGSQSAANSVSLSYSADPSFSSTITTKKGFIGNSNSVTNCQYYSGATGVPADSSGATARATQTLMETQSSYTGFTFGTNATNWAMPTASTFSSPSGFLSPVLYWQCGANGISC